MTVEIVKNFYRELMEMNEKDFNVLIDGVGSIDEKTFLLEMRNLILRDKTKLYLSGLLTDGN